MSPITVLGSFIHVKFTIFLAQQITLEICVNLVHFLFLVLSCITNLIMCTFLEIIASTARFAPELIAWSSWIILLYSYFKLFSSWQEFFLTFPFWLEVFLQNEHRHIFTTLYKDTVQLEEVIFKWSFNYTTLTSRTFQLMSSRCPFPLVGFGVCSGAATGNDDSWCQALEPGMELEFPE